MSQWGYELVVVTYQSRRQVELLMEGLPPDTPVAIVDNAGGSDRMREWATQRPAARYLDGGGHGYAHAANMGAWSSPYDVVVFLNPDTRPSLETLDQLVADVRADERCALSAAVLVEADGTPEIGSGGWEPTVWRALAHTFGIHKLIPSSGMWARPALGADADLDWVNGGCIAVRRDTFIALGGFDEQLFVYCLELELGRAVREHGMYQRLRTDLPVLHGRGAGSGAPSLEMMRLRGAELARYLRLHNRPSASRVMIGALATGFLARSIQRRITGDATTAEEHLAYARGLATGRAYVAGREVRTLLAKPSHVST